MTVENISWSISTKESCRLRRGLNPRPPGLQSDGASKWATEAGPWWFLPSFKSLGLSVQEKKQTGFQDGCHLGFPIRTILAIFCLPVTPMLPTKFRVNQPFCSGEEVKNRFSRWLPWWPFWISDWKDFSYFWCISHHDASYQVSSQMAFWFRRKSQKEIFKMAAILHLGFQIGMF